LICKAKCHVANKAPPVSIQQAFEGVTADVVLAVGKSTLFNFTGVYTR
jgi:hypothetical protein